MGWLGGRLLRWGRPRRNAGERPADEERRGRKAPPRGALVLLTPDAAGTACFRLNVFPDADSAAAFLHTWYAGGVDRTTAAFWAMHEEPAPTPSLATQSSPEALVLVRDAARPGVVYAFSFAGMDEARSFARVEAVRGVQLRQLMVYWSVSVNIERDGAGSFLLEPAVPPPGRRWSEPTRTVVVREGHDTDGESAAAAAGEARVLQVAEEILRQVQGREATPAGGPPAAAAPAERPEANETPPQTDEQELRDVFDELTRTLRSGWEQRDGPFQGFGSPPGKF